MVFSSENFKMIANGCIVLSQTLYKQKSSKKSPECRGMEVFRNDPELDYTVVALIF